MPAKAEAQTTRVNAKASKARVVRWSFTGLLIFDC
jgi:hypothetical protein